MASFICLDIGASCWLGSWSAICLQQAGLPLEAVVVGFMEAESEGKPRIFYLVPWPKQNMAKIRAVWKGFPKSV